jgi:predicted CoA-substrate-specific enzyme activase
MNKMDSFLFSGIDIGSTTAKVVVTDKNGRMVFSRYRRHRAETIETVRSIFKEALDLLGDVSLDLAVTGSAGMGVAETYGLPFVQEMVASAQHIKKSFPQTRTFIEIGGEDSKIIFFDEQFHPDLRMNGTCAGGTGAFIDQMSVLLNVDSAELNSLAEKSTRIYPIASRCGVFAKTDIQALLSQQAAKEDIAASIFRAVAIQVVTALSHGREVKKKILFAGGPLTFFPELRRAFIDLLEIDNREDLIIPEHSELLPAMGAAAVRNGSPCRKTISNLLALEQAGPLYTTVNGDNSLPAMFNGKIEFDNWKKRHEQHRVARIDRFKTKGKDLFLGIDSGSTTTKIVLIDAEGHLVDDYYHANNGDPIQAVKLGLDKIREKFSTAGLFPRIIRSAATGYGESLVRAAFGLNDGVVETMAHYRAARHFEPEVSFIIDIGGQDMKAIYIQDHNVAEIQVNEACSSGCGSFIETFARSLGYGVEEFAGLACTGKTPFDLGTRCTVFMNSKVKQALREGASVADISAGLAYSVIKNALHKVLKLQNFAVLGSKIVVQGGTFRNQAVLRAFEILLGRDVINPDISELMGAYGAALTALANHRSALAKPSVESHGVEMPIDRLRENGSFTQKTFQCRHCENRCPVLQLTFAGGNRFYTGNRCERYFSNSQDPHRRGENLIHAQLQLLFERETEPEGKPILAYGLPRCLNMYENFPFWCAFLTGCGFEVILSAESTFALYEKGLSTVMSDNICFPAKLAHGHIFDFAGKKVDRIFFPTVVYEQEEFDDALNTFNCPVVTGYPDLLKNAINPERKFGIPLDNPIISFKDFNLLKGQLYQFFSTFGIDYRTVSAALEKGKTAQNDYRKQLRSMTETKLSKGEVEGRMTIVLAGRPYHMDSLINHGIPNLLTELGVDVISEAAVTLSQEDLGAKDIHVLTQWSYTNRLYAAAGWVTETPDTQMVQLTSFGCGPDAVATDEVKAILRDGGKVHTLIKMDEIANLGAVRIRLRSMLAAMQENNGKGRPGGIGARQANGKTIGTANGRTLIAPYFSEFYSPLIPAAFKPLGYRVEVLPPQDKSSAEWGLKTINNDMCYPAILVSGDIIKAFHSGRYAPEKTAVILTQTGGQCRASSYVSLIKKGLAAAGLEEVPVIAVSDGDISPQPEFDIDQKRLMRQLALGIIFADPLARMYLAVVAREKTAGTAKKLHAKYLVGMEKGIENADYPYLLNLLEQAVTDFNNIDIYERSIPRVGIVGEIFVKYNFFSNGNIIDWLSTQGIEVVLPPLQSFFAQRFINEAYNQKMYFKRSFIDRAKNRLLELYSKYHLAQIEQVMQKFRFYRKAHDLRELAEITDDIVSLANQFGEGWLLTAEMIAMLREGTSHIICLQPFGCIANHITGRGVENKLREMFPALNLLSLDMDAGASEVNILNRLHLLVSEAREQEARDEETVPAAVKTVWRFTLPDVLPRELRALNHYTSLEVEKWRAWGSHLGLRERTQSLRRKIGL